VRSQKSGPGRAKPFEELLRGVPDAEITGDPRVEVCGLAYDSRKVVPGGLFVAVTGEKADGHDFLLEARERGAKAFLLETGRAQGITPPDGGAIAVIPDTRAAMAPVARAFYGDPAARLVLAGVTGTNGKSTTALIIDEIFRGAGIASGVIGTIEYRIGERKLKAPHTTPEAIDLHALFAEMLVEGVTHAAMEVSSHALSLHRVDGCPFEAAVFTNLTPEHLDFHQDMAAYLVAKQALFEDPQFLPASGRRANAINLDDEAGEEIAARALGDTLTYGFSPAAHCRADDVRLSATGTQFTVHHPVGRVPVRMKLVGHFNVYNALGAMTACIGLGLDAEVACAALERMEPVRGRFERVPARTRNVLVDYAHSPDGLQRALEAARAVATGRVTVVFGCGGDRDRTKRPVMGELGSRLADGCVITSDNPRSEKPEAIIDEILAGIPQDRRGKCSVEVDRATAIRKAIEEAGKDDLVLIAGKGHENYQIFADRTIDFDDRAVAAAVIRELEGDGDA